MTSSKNNPSAGDIAREALLSIPNPLGRFPGPLRIPEVRGMHHYLSGEAFFVALKNEVEQLVRSAPEDHDILVQAFNVFFREIRYVEPHTIVFRGALNSGQDASVIAHFSQCVAHVVYLPKAGPERVIAGFWRDPAGG
ncbi:hypothetical protein OH491_13655 [Termitidicoccus mucosus]